MPIEEYTGITFPAHDTPKDDTVMSALLMAVASCGAIHLRQGGYFSDLEAERLLSEYQGRLSFFTLESSPPLDFVAFVAESQAAQHCLTAEGEVSRMQKILRWSLADRVRNWTFGPFPGPVDALYCHCISLRAACCLLGCPSMLVGESNIVHVASVNPVAALVASAWINQELTIMADGESPFVFPLMVDLPAWHTMHQRHFAGV